jgi:hypothetical protein
MWDLTVPGGGDHDFYILAERDPASRAFDVAGRGTLVLVHNCNDVALGYAWAGLRKFANDNGFTHFLDAETLLQWRGQVTTALKDPNTTIHVLTRGFSGGFKDMALRGFADPNGALATEREMSFIARAVANGQRSWQSVQFYDDAGRLLPTGPEWDWFNDFPRTDPVNGLGGLR